MKKGLAIWLLVATILAIIILRAGRYSFSNNYDVTNLGPTGTSAFIELLNRSKIKSELKSEIKTDLYGASTAIAIVSPRSIRSFQKFASQVLPGKTLIGFIIPQKFDKNATRSVSTIYGSTQMGVITGVRKSSAEWSPEDEASDSDSNTTPLLYIDTDVLASASTIKGSKIIRFEEGRIITNEFIAKASNASTAMGLVKATVPGDSKVIVFTGFAGTDNSPGLIEKLGRFVHGAWNQLLLIIIITFIAFSIRFGFAPEQRAKQRGGRELIDGLATLSRRKKQAQWSLRTVLDRTIRELEVRHRVGREQIIKEGSKYLSAEELATIKTAISASSADISEAEALVHAKALKRLV